MSYDMNSGYVGFSMSRRAAAAYDNGEKPLTKWRKAALLDAISNINPDIAKAAKKLTVAELRSAVLTHTSWHHTSSYCNATDFYSIDEDAVAKLTAEQIRQIISDRQPKENQPPEKSVFRGDIHYLVWGGTRKYPTSTSCVLTDVNIEQRGYFYIVTDDNGTELLRKKIGSNGTRVVNYAERDLQRQRRELLDKVRREHSTPAANALYKQLCKNGMEYSQSGNIYAMGRKPGRLDYELGIDKFFSIGETRLATNNEGGYLVEYFNGEKWVPETEQ